MQKKGDLNPFNSQLYGLLETSWLKRNASTRELTTLHWELQH